MPAKPVSRMPRGSADGSHRAVANYTGGVPTSDPMRRTASRLRVLFVDDEPPVLHGLQRACRGLRDDWEVRFAEGGAVALVELERAPADVVVSDMRMPGMSGGELLAAVSRRWPATVRVILSGHADRDLVHRTIGSAHQFLQKPCDMPTIERLIGGVAQLRRSLANATLHRLVGGMRAIPNIPAAHLELLALLDEPRPRPAAIAAAIAADPGMSVLVLHLVNSAFFGQRRTVANPARAAQILGIETIRAVVRSTDICAHPSGARRRWFDADAFWRHSRRVSRLAGRIAVAVGLQPEAVEEAGMAGLVHDIGHLMLAVHQPQEHAILARRTLHAGDIHAERMILGANHGEIGAYLLGLWGLPPAVVEAVALHHDPRRAAQPGPGPLGCVHAADAIMHRAEGQTACNPLAEDYLAGLGWLAHAPRWMAWADDDRSGSQTAAPAMSS